jgi:serine/threonine-protein kinase
MSTLTQAGFTVATTSVDSIQTKGTVVTQSPGGGSSAGLGTIIRLGVSTGVPGTATVPGVTGMSVTQAQAALEGAGFVVSIVDKIVTNPAQYDVVLSQSPGGSTSATQGSTVRITVGRRA